ncbi:MAG: hypothetical protein P8L85_07600, partial [Rubripirellula sp.]|nr:hypothetical protein [Rubripirellula sp.]
MHRLISNCFFSLAVVSLLTGTVFAQQNNGLQLQKLPVPGVHAKEIATKLSLQYRDVAGVTISPDARKGELVVMAPSEAQRAIAQDVRAMLASHG